MAAMGRLVEELYLVSLPENCKFTVTKLENNRKGSWYTLFETRKQPPYEVNPTSKKALVATSVLGTTSVTDSGEGLSNTLYFTISGTISKNYFEKKGYITFNSTEWPSFPRIGRPDYSIITYTFDGSKSESISQQTPTLITPDPYNIAFLIKNQEMYMIVSREDNLGTKVMSSILGGILNIHTAGLKWVVSKI